jgi:hypothetical protein
MNPQFVTRHLVVNDIPQLLRLELRQWEAHQCADAKTMHSRMLKYPLLCVGVFCVATGDALASLFMRPASRYDMAEVRSWADCANLHEDIPPGRHDCLFGISMTSSHPQAVGLMVDFFLPYALKNCWHSIYLGSPMPGLHEALQSNPELNPKNYAFSKHRGLPADPQLRYYYRMGFKDLVAVLPNYFPHARSLDYAALLRAKVPLSQLRSVWRLLPLAWLQLLVPILIELYDLLPPKPVLPVLRLPKIS